MHIKLKTILITCKSLKFETVSNQDNKLDFIATNDTISAARQLKECCAVLNTMEQKLREYQENLSKVNEESMVLQQESNTLNIKLNNRRVLIF